MLVRMPSLETDIRPTVLFPGGGETESTYDRGPSRHSDASFYF